MKGDMSGFSFESAVMGGPFGKAIWEDVPEVITYTTFYKMPRPVLLSRGENRFYEESIIYGDSVFLEFFGYHTRLGDPSRMLSDPYSLVLTKSGAEKYFGNEDPLGKSIRMNNLRDFTVTGIIEDPVYNSHLNFDILASYKTLLEQENYRNLITTFYAFVTYNYIKLDESAEPEMVKEKIDVVVEKYMGEGMKESGSHFELFLQPVRDIHLDSQLVHELETNGNRSSVNIFSAISLLILFIACVNFINLTTARSAVRSKEIGIRQSSGAGRRNLFHQFIAESVFFALASAMLAGILVEILLPWFHNFTGIHPEASGFSFPVLVVFLLTLGILIGFVSGLYPALVMSGKKPLLRIRGRSGQVSTARLLRNILVVIQLGITLFLVFNTIVIYKQIRLINRVDIGIDKDGLMVIPLRDPSMYGQYEVLKNEMLSLPVVKDVTAFSSFLGDFQQRRGFYVEGYERQDLWMLHHLYAEPEYLEVMGTKIILGRNFRRGSIADSNGVIINRAMMKQAGWDNPIGKKIIMPDRGIEKEFTVIGVVEDFHYASIHNRVESLLVFNNIARIRYLGLRMENEKSSIELVGQRWSGFYPEYPFDYFYQEDFYENLYREDQRMGSLFMYFSVLAILISLLGLFGLILFTSSRRSREIGIRKVSGGTSYTLVMMLLKEYPVLMLAASAISLPLSWYFAQDWLKDFTVKTDISSGIYIISVFLVMIICLGAILFQTLKTARANPVDALRYE
jgi:putative ABC transport system permease protein